MTLDGHELVFGGDTFCLGLVKLGSVRREVRNCDLVAEIVLDSVGKHEIAVGETLHKGGSAKTVCAVVGEVALADCEKTLD